MKSLNFFFIILGFALLNSCSSSDENPIEGTRDCEYLVLNVRNWTNNYNAWVTNEGGVPPITYLWSNGSTDDAIGGEEGTLDAGTYSVTATDGRGCTSTGSITIEHELAIVESIVDCIGSDSAVIASDVSVIIGNEIIEKGVCFSTTPNPTTNDTKVMAENFGYDFSSTLPSLSLATTYYVRGYVINQGGVSYSDEVNFTTRSSPSPFSIGQEYQGGIISSINCDGISGNIIYIDINFDTFSWKSAKGWCEDSTFNGYSDWYLPNVKQLQEMYINLHKTSIYKLKTGSRIYDNYWSSFNIYNNDACGNFDAYYFDFDDGDFELLEICYNLNFIPIRDF